MQNYYTKDFGDNSVIPQYIQEVTDRISCTMGPYGRFLTVADENNVIIIKDGATAARLQSYPELKGMVAQLIVDACSETERQVGDGTTATAVLIRELYNRYFKSKFSGNVHEYVRGMQAALSAIEEFLKTKTFKITGTAKETPTDLLNVAKISANGDVELANLIAELVWKIGPQGSVVVNASEHEKTYVEHKEGYVVKSGLVSRHFFNNAKGCSFKDALVVIIDDRIEYVDQIRPIMSAWDKIYGQNQVVQGQNGRQEVRVNPKPIILICSGITGDALSLLTLNARQGTHKIAVLNAPSSGQERKVLLEDLRKMTGTYKVYSQTAGQRLSTFGKGSVGTKMEFGICENFVANEKEAIFFLNGDTEINYHRLGESKKMTVAQVQDLLVREIEEEGNEILTEDFQKERIAHIRSGVGVIYSGGSTEVERKRIRTVVDDVWRASMSALKDGVVKGGGAALYQACQALSLHQGIPSDKYYVFKDVLTPPTAESSVPDFMAGKKAVLSCGNVIIQQILRNAGINDFVGQEDLLKDEVTFTIKNGSISFVSAVGEGILDPVSVVTTALRNAISVTSNLISTAYFQILTNGEVHRENNN